VSLTKPGECLLLNVASVSY